MTALAMSWLVIAPGSMLSVTTGNTKVEPIKINCRKVLYLDTVVGCTSAEGMEKSQYRMNVFGVGKEA